MEMEQKDCSMKVNKLIEKHTWIASEKQLFGRSGTDYDFLSLNPSKAKEELEKLQAEQSGCVTQTFQSMINTLVTTVVLKLILLSFVSQEHFFLSLRPQTF